MFLGHALGNILNASKKFFRINKLCEIVKGVAVSGSNFTLLES